MRAITSAMNRNRKPGPARGQPRNLSSPITHAMAEQRYDDAVDLLTDALVEADGSQEKAAETLRVTGRTVRKWIQLLRDRVRVDVREKARRVIARRDKAARAIGTAKNPRARGSRASA